MSKVDLLHSIDWYCRRGIYWSELNEGHSTFIFSEKLSKIMKSWLILQTNNIKLRFGLFQQMSTHAFWKNVFLTYNSISEVIEIWRCLQEWAFFYTSYYYIQQVYIWHECSRRNFEPYLLVRPWVYSCSSLYFDGCCKVIHKFRLLKSSPNWQKRAKLRLGTQVCRDSVLYGNYFTINPGCQWSMCVEKSTFHHKTVQFLESCGARFAIARLFLRLY